jgi:signal transduction histidine kinase
MKPVRVWMQFFALAVLFSALAVLFAALVSMFPGTNPSRRPPSARQGQLDLTGWHFENDGMVKLTGEWEWHWGELLAPEQLRARQTAGPPPVIAVPSSWSSGSSDGSHPREGYATFRLRIRWHDAPRLMALRVQSVASSYRLWVDGVPLGGLGQVGTSRAATVPQDAPRTYWFPAQPDGVEIVIQAANYEHRHAGLWQTIELGTPEQVQNQHERKLAIDLMLFGSLFTMSMYHLVLYAIRRKDRSTLYFGAYCLIMAVRTTFVGELFFNDLFPQLPWAERLRLEYGGAFLGLPVFALFVRELFPQETSPRAIRLMLAASSLYMIVLLAAPPSVFTRTMSSFQAVVVLGAAYFMSVFLRAVLRRRPGAPLALIGFLIYAGSLVNDILYFDETIRTGSYSPLGLLVFVMMHSTVLSMKFAQAFASKEQMTQQLALQAMEVQMLNGKLQELNRGLEEGIAKRTEELQQSNERLAQKAAEIVRIDSARRQLLSNISHELRTPMTSIRGYVEALLDNVFATAEEQRRYLQLIHDKMLGLNRLISDLFELSKLESGLPDLHFHSVPVASFLAKTRLKHELDIVRSGLRFEWEDSGAASLPESACVILDPERIDQVLTNLVSNAVRYTPAGGTVRFSFAVQQAEREGEPVRELVVRVEDTGSGIAGEDLPFIFERFYRGKEAPAGGSGLGLAIAKEIVAHHGGSMWAQSREGEGSVFGFTLLLYEEEQS